MSIRGGIVSIEDIDAELFGVPTRETISYLRDRVERYAPHVTNIFNGFFEDTRQIFERYNGDATIRRIRARIRRSTNPMRVDSIRPFTKIEEFQTAKSTMQRYIMANVVSRILAEQQVIDGYSDENVYRDYSIRGLRDPDFMRVVDGVIFTEDYHDIKTHDKEDAWVAYQDLNESDERDLDIIEQSDILSTWDVLESFYALKKKDPTSILNEDM